MDTINTLTKIVLRLYSETDGYMNDQSDVQLWYNRGYANGIVSALRSKNLFTAASLNIPLDDEELHQGQNFMEWEKAYHHGFEMGQREASEVLPA